MNFAIAMPAAGPAGSGRQPSEKVQFRSVSAFVAELDDAVSWLAINLVGDTKSAETTVRELRLADRIDLVNRWVSSFAPYEGVGPAMFGGISCSRQFPSKDNSAAPEFR